MTRISIGSVLRREFRADPKLVDKIWVAKYHILH